MLYFSCSKEKVEDQMLYSYTRCINGFAAVLDESQVAALNGKNDTVVFISQASNALFSSASSLFHTTLL